MITIRPATSMDADKIWEIFHAVVETGDTYPFAPATPRGELSQLWMAPYMHTYVAERDGEMVGTYVLKANMPGLGSHVANGSYMVHAQTPLFSWACFASWWVMAQLHRSAVCRDRMFLYLATAPFQPFESVTRW